MTVKESAASDHIPHARSFTAVLSASLVALMIGAMLLAATAIYSATRETDVASVERQSNAALRAFELSVDELALQQETVAVWDDAASHLLARRLDLTWIHDNVGLWLHNIFQHDESYVFTGRDELSYKALSGKLVSRRRIDPVRPELASLLRALRGQSSYLAGPHDRLAGKPIARASTVRTTARANHVSRVQSIDGRPAAVSAMLIKSSTPGYVDPQGTWPVLISVRYLDRGFLSELGSRQLIRDPRFSRTAATRAGEHAVAIRQQDGRLFGYLVWTPDYPGRKVLQKLIPWTILMLSVLAGFILFVGLRLRSAMTEVASAESQAAHSALHDPLTCLPNRTMFQRTLDELTATACPAFGLALLDLDNFKLTNDTLGHDAGDALLIALAERLSGSVRNGDVVARLGGDEFAILFMGVTDGEQLRRLASDLLQRVSQPVVHLGKSIDSQASVGVTLHRSQHTSEQLLKEVDLALYAAKNAGRGTYRLYEPSMHLGMVAQQRMLTTARLALAADVIRPFYQPKVDLRTGDIVGFEALLRCCDSGRPPAGPEHLEAAFENPSLAVQLTDRMMDQVVSDICSWRATGVAFGHVAINVSAPDLRSGDFAGRLLASLRAASIPPHCIQVEVTESVLLGRGIEHVERSFSDLSKAGIKLALDDFGTGFASLSHLKQFPVDIIKIDRAFIRDLQIDPDDGAIVDALVGLARALNIEVVAEGIETGAQRDFLEALGCKTGQGFLFSKAVRASRVPGLLRRIGRAEAA